MWDNIILKIPSSDKRDMLNRYRTWGFPAHMLKK